MATFNNLVEMQESSCRENRDRDMYGIRKNGSFEWMTFGEFGKMVDEFRSGLASLGVKKNDKVAIIANNCIEWPVCAYGAYGLGAHFVPMYESQPLKEWEYIINDSSAKILLVRTRELFNKVRDLPQKIDALEQVVLLQGEAGKYLSFEALKARGRENSVKSYHPDPEEPFGLIYTSGTTGNPKGVILTHGNLMAELDSVSDILDFQSTDRSLSFLPWGHLMGQIEEVHFLILKGFSAAIVDDIQKIMEYFQTVRPTIFFTVPKLFQRLYSAVTEKIDEKGGLGKFLFEKGRGLSSQARQGMSLGLKDKLLLAAAKRIVFGKINTAFGGQLRMSLCGGAALNPEVIGFMEDLGVMVYEGYGLTETTMAISANSLDGRRYGSVGRALKDVRIALDESVEGAGKDEGEIIVYGPHIAAGYHNQPELFQDCLTPDGGYRTGDLGRLDADGFLYITGRIKELYKLENGKYIAPAPLEEALRQSPYISFAMFYGFNRSFNVLLIVPDFETLQKLPPNTDRDALFQREIERFSKNFKPFEKPKKFLVIEDEWTTENGILTPTLKIKRAVITKTYLPMINALYEN